MSNKGSKIVMVCESHSDFTINKDGKDYVLEGIFAELGVENGNGRIYEEKEYLPHLDYLKKRIKKGNLVGELDHPEKFDISLQKVSHIIEDLNYNADKRQVTGKIRLLNTDAGKNAKAMLDDGVRLSISSRAAGVVKEDKKVQIKKIFTYDLVAEPGFENAQLSLMNDSLGISEDSSLHIYEMSDVTDEMLSWLSENENQEISATKILELRNKNNSDTMPNTDKNQTVTVDQMDKYSEIIREKFADLEKALEEKNAQISELKSELEKHEQYSNYLAEQIEDKESTIEEITETVDSVIEYSNYIAKHTDNLIDFGDSIVERTNQNTEYSEYLCEHLDSNINETQNIIKYADYIGEKTDTSIQYTESLAENLQLISDHSDHLVEHVNNTIGYIDYVGETLNTSIEYSQTIATAINEGNFSSDKPNTKINESLSSKNGGALSNKIDSILEAVKKQNVTSTAQNAFGFSLLSESKQREFALLENDNKQRIMKAVNEAKPVSESHFLHLWEEALAPTNIDKISENIINEMPAEYKSVWNNLDESTKYHIMQQASVYKLNTPYQIRNFWQTRQIMNQAINMQKLNEDLTADKITGTVEAPINENKNTFAQYSGYSTQHIASIANALSKKF